MVVLFLILLSLDSFLPSSSSLSSFHLSFFSSLPHHVYTLFDTTLFARFIPSFVFPSFLHSFLLSSFFSLPHRVYTLFDTTLFARFIPLFLFPPFLLSCFLSFVCYLYFSFLFF